MDYFIIDHGKLLKRLNIYLDIIHMAMSKSESMNNLDKGIKPYWFKIINPTPGRNIYSELNREINDLLQ